MQITRYIKCNMTVTGTFWWEQLRCVHDSLLCAQASLFFFNVNMILVNYVVSAIKNEASLSCKILPINKKILSCDTFKSPSVLDFISLWFAQDEKKQFKYSNWDISRSPEKITMDWQVSHILTILIQSRLLLFPCWIKDST